MAAIAAALLASLLCGVFPIPFPNRLAVVDGSVIDNSLYDNTSWWSSGGEMAVLHALNEARLPYFRKVFAAAGVDSEGVQALDVGCGGGFVALELAAAGFNVTGLDASAPSLAQAQAESKSRGLDHSTRFIKGSLYALPFRDASFDVVIAADVLEHLSDLRTAASEIARVLRPGGIVVFDTISRTFYSWLFVWLGAQQILGFLPRNAHDWRLFITPLEAATLLESVGFAVDQNGADMGVPWKGLDVKISAVPPRRLWAALRDRDMAPLLVGVEEVNS